MRNGDRLYFENQGFDPKTLAAIKQTTLSDIIARDTDTNDIQKDAFAYYDRHTGTLGGVASENPNAPQLIIGSDGSDALVGGPNSAVLVAGKGNQTLTGGAGSDTFDFGKQGTNAERPFARTSNHEIVSFQLTTLGYSVTVRASGHLLWKLRQLLLHTAMSSPSQDFEHTKDVQLGLENGSGRHPMVW